MPLVNGVQRIALICDMAEEQWPSMEICAKNLASHLVKEADSGFEFVIVQPAMSRQFGRIPFLDEQKSFNADRLVGRFWHYRRHLLRSLPPCDLYHILDHSYAHLANSLPAKKSVITCHDLDAFECLVDNRATRSLMFCQMTKLVLKGFKRANRISCVSHSTRDNILRHNLVPASRLRVIHNGISEDFSNESDESTIRSLNSLLSSQLAPILLHVGSSIPRKRVEFLFQIFAGVQRRYSGAHLVKVGAGFSQEQERQMSALGIMGKVTHLRDLPTNLLAALYRRAAVVLQPSESEGFGLPVAEALAAGGVVVASDLPVFREIGSSLAHFCPLTDLDSWVNTISKIIAEYCVAEHSRTIRKSFYSRFSWDVAARKTLNLYQEALRGPVS